MSKGSLTQDLQNLKSLLRRLADSKALKNATDSETQNLKSDVERAERDMDETIRQVRRHYDAGE